MRGALVLVAGLALLIAGCSPASLGQTDDFGQRAAEEAAAQERALMAEQREAERREREREAERKALAKENAAWLVLDLEGCAARGDSRACGSLERFITEYPESNHVQEAAEKLRLGRAAIAEAERKVAEEAAAEAERERKAEAARRAAPRPATPADGGDATEAAEERGKVCCCDGTISPTCTYVKRGCCSHHGGVCACP